MLCQPKLDFVLLFVESPQKSQEFYTHLLQQSPVESSSTFVMFALANGVMLGLWSRYTAQPAVTSLPGAMEISFNYEDIDGLYQSWLDLGIQMAQPPTEMEHGRTFVALDPDGHRIRINRLKEEV
ncbi:MAG: VOC family protein [Verrucomicrobia bacterium]|nr:VOC family protein [Verrucomicrobiota bacterium]MBS0645759.1 VOC family protein [Verrucomicrobiota bacterium]